MAEAAYQLEPSEAAQILLERRRAREHLLPFTQYTKPDFEAARHHSVICGALEEFEQDVAAKRSPRLLIEAPPRHTKSELGTRRFPAWALGRHPAWQIISTAYSADLASDFGRDVRDIVASQEYARLFETRLRQDSAAVNRWQTNGGGVYVATGVGGPITGRGAHIGIVDDPLKNWQDANSETIKESQWNWYTSTFYTRLMPGGGILLILTRWAEDDIAGRALATEDFRRVRLQAIDEQGRALWPAWYGLDALQKIKSVTPPRQWEALYQQNPTPEEGLFFNRESFQRFRLGEEPARLHRYVMSDFGVTDAQESTDPDPTCFGDWGVDHQGHWWLLDRYHDRVSADKWAAQLVDWFKAKKPLKFFGEAGQIRRSVEPFLKTMMRNERAFTTLEWITRNRDKQAMAAAFRGMCELGMIHIPLTDWGEDLISELLKFPAGEHDDQVDMCALVGLAVDKGIAASLPEEEPPRERPEDGYAAYDDDDSSWKIA